MSPLERSCRIVELILADIRQANLVGPGGIGRIEQIATDRYEARILREGAIDVLTYEIAFADDGTPSISGRSDRTEAP